MTAATDPSPSDPAIEPTLLPRTLRASAYDFNDLDSVHSFMKSRESRSPERMLGEAKAIVDGGPKHLNSSFPAFVAVMGIDEAIPAKEKKKPQELRPGLGRRRPRFSLKPATSMLGSQHTVDIEPSLNIDQLGDPGQFFAAFERIENANKEIQRQRDPSSVDLDAYNPSTNTRNLRPGILGKSVSYKHRYSSVSINEEMLTASQEALEQDVPAAPDRDLQNEVTDPDVGSQEIELDGSITKAENRVNEILDELLSGNSEDLDGDGALSLLQARFSTKPIDLGRPCLPELPDTSMTAYMDLEERTFRLQRASLDAKVFVKAFIGETPRRDKQLEESSRNTMASPTPPRSPFASISLLKKRILQSIPSADPFSPVDVDLSEPRNVSSLDKILQRSDQSDKIEKYSDYGRLDSHLKGGKTRGIVSNKGLTVNQDSACAPGASGQSVSLDVRSSESQIDIEDQNVHENNSRTPCVGVRLRLDESQGDMQDQNVHDNMDTGTLNCNLSRHDMDSDINVSTQDKEELENAHLEQERHAQSVVNIEVTTVFGSTNGSTHVSDQFIPPAVEEQSADINSTTSQRSPEHQTKTHLSPNKQCKSKRPPGFRRELQALSRRKSLAEAGTSFENGVRRSKRRRSKPLEFWRGERMLYGRIDESFKLIGVRYLSPAKGKLNVKSFVSDEYKELLELAARH